MSGDAGGAASRAGLDGLVPLPTAAEMRQWDRGAIEGIGVPERVLMESAGGAAARAIHRLYPTGRIVAAVGRGNNGGDAMVMLRSLLAWGRDVLAVPVGEAETRADLCHGWNVPVAANGDVASALGAADVGVDAILGTGATGAPRGDAAIAVRALNASGVPLVALDGPTGVDLTDGSAPGEAIRAALTLSFGAPKRGLLRFPGRRHAGRIIVLEIGLPPLSPAEVEAAVITPAWAFGRLPARSPDAHKGSVGSVTVLAGRTGMCGAAIMAATGALRAGSGMVRVVSTAENRIPVQQAVPEALFVDRAGDGVAAALAAADAIVAGPGMGVDDRAIEALRAVLDHEMPTLLDADALTLLSREPELLPAGRTEPLVLTPHPAEMARLLGETVEMVLHDPFGAAVDAARRFDCAVLLKGTPSVVAAPRGPILANVTGHAGVATGGMGDTLAGITAALLAAGATARDAAAMGVFFAGRAAEIAGRGRSLLPRDVAEALPAALGDDSPFGSFTGPGIVLDLQAPY